MSRTYEDQRAFFDLKGARNRNEHADYKAYCPFNWRNKRRIEVISKRTASMTAIAVCLAILAVPPANAQSPLGSTFQDQNPTEPHHFRIYQMMKDMTQEMTKMTEQMSQGALTPDQQKQMAIRMQSMSAIMHRLSGLEARPAIKHGDMDKQLDQMQKQMDQMMRD